MKCRFYVIRDGHQVGPFYAASMRGALGHIPTILEHEDRFRGASYQLQCATERVRMLTRAAHRKIRSLSDRVAAWRARNEDLRAQIRTQVQETALLKAATAMFNPSKRGDA